ncbi:MAG: SGNH/GDSL hydrolase family protein [Armatimonadetes bacterium]|nr:SGNH/GDSL hydrolase family protein [Armatimonadota bacterium]
MRKDYRDTPVHKVVLLGESNAYGMCAIDPRNEWFQTLVNLIRDFQDEPVAALNYSIPGCVISPRSPGYACLSDDSKPSALERYEAEVIESDPDLAIYALGLNDSRCGYPVANFIEDIETMVSETVNRTEALVVVTSPYWNTQYDEELWRSCAPEWASDPRWEVFCVSGPALVTSYVAEMKKMAERNGCLFVDLYSLLDGSQWLLNDDQVHFTDVGQRVIGQAVFNVIAANCSFIGAKSLKQAREGGFDIWNTGGTNCTGRMLSAWRNKEVM